MATDERSRHQMYLKFEEVLGHEVADTLIEHLPPTGWGDVARKSDLEHLAAATKRDVEQLGIHLESKMEAMESRFEAKLEAGLRSVTITMLTIVSGLFIALAGLAFAAARLT